MKPIDQAWIMFFRNGLEASGEWCAWEGTASRTRQECIEAFLDGAYAGAGSRNKYRSLRRRGVIRCAKATLWADLPGADR